MAILRRDLCQDRYGNVYSCNTTWSDWARWVVLTLIIVLAAFVFCLFSCLSARRRRRMGQQPLYGTGWANRNQQQHGYYPQQQNNPNTYYAHQHPTSTGGSAPPYTPYAAPGQASYRAEQTSGIELPENAHAGRYEPPVGPPPGKK